MRFDRASVVTVGVGLLVTVAGCGSPPGTESEGSTREMATEQFERYIDAVNADDAEAVADVIGRPASDDDVRARMLSHGGEGLHDVQIEVRTEFADVYNLWWVASDDAGNETEGYEVIGMEGGDWTFAPLSTGTPPPR